MDLLTPAGLVRSTRRKETCRAPRAPQIPHIAGLSYLKFEISGEPIPAVFCSQTQCDTQLATGVFCCACFHHSAPNWVYVSVMCFLATSYPKTELYMARQGNINKLNMSNAPESNRFIHSYQALLMVQLHLFIYAEILQIT